MTDDDWVVGDMLALPIPAHAAALRSGGESFLTQAFRACGVLGSDNHVVAITEFEPWEGGGTGAKLLLAVRYADESAGLPTELFVKFSRNFDDVIRDRTRHHMESEVRLAALSRTPGFPVAVPTCLYADFHHASGTGIIITARIAYGRGGIEPHYPKCLDWEMPDPLAHYRALIGAIARLAGTHKAGHLPDSVAEQFPFDFDKALASDRLPYAADGLQRKVARLADFAARYPQLLPPALAAPAFLAELEALGLLFLQQQDAIKRLLHSRPEFIALCHWNANVDNAWFWREPDGAMACGLMDWGSVGQMNLAMTLWGCLSGAEPEVWDERLDELLHLFAADFEGCGAPALDPAELRLHLQLYVAMMGLAYLLDAPARILKEVPALPVSDLTQVESRFDPRFTASETARVQLLMMINFLNLMRTASTKQTLQRMADGDALLGV